MKLPLVLLAVCCIALIGEISAGSKNTTVSTENIPNKGVNGTYPNVGTPQKSTAAEAAIRAAAGESTATASGAAKAATSAATSVNRTTGTHWTWTSSTKINWTVAKHAQSSAKTAARMPPKASARMNQPGVSAAEAAARAALGESSATAVGAATGASAAKSANKTKTIKWKVKTNIKTANTGAPSGAAVLSLAQPKASVQRNQPGVSAAKAAARSAVGKASATNSTVLRMTTFHAQPSSRAVARPSKASARSNQQRFSEAEAAS